MCLYFTPGMDSILENVLFKVDILTQAVNSAKALMHTVLTETFDESLALYQLQGPIIPYSVIVQGW